jgi:serine/threonine protein kinase
MSAMSQDSAARRYRIEKYLTEGGMGAIYIGKKLGPGGFAKDVVLKQLLPEYTARPEFRDLFFREAKISATLDHANIVHTFDLVESDQSLFIVMEYVRGADLRTIIRRARHRKRELSPAAAIHIALEILSGLSYAHARRDATGKSLDIIHRDVSPSNIICSAQGAAKLSDFGIAKASTYSSVFYRVRGKVGYMSPEQARSQTIDHRCDLFSLSVCLYESLTGERLFVGDLNTPADEIYGVPILPVSRKRAGLPGTLDAVLARALAPNVDDRYQNAAELGEALRTVAHRSGLGFSAPELAAHLHEILGADPERWLRDDPAQVVTDPKQVPAVSSQLVGTEASSIGIVNDIPEDEAARAVLSPNAVSGSKDFDLDSMLNDEATRPGGEPRRSSQTPSAPASDPGDGRVQMPATPPPVWTRNSSPFPLATPKPARGAPLPPAMPSPPASKLPIMGGARPLPPALPPAGRPLPRATQRATAVPPPFTPRSPAPPPPPFPAGSDARDSSFAADEIEDTTPGPRALAAAFPSAADPHSFDIEDALTPAPVGSALGHAASSGPPAGFRAHPPAPYPVPSPEPDLMLNQPQTLDFRGAVTALLPDKKGGPPVWLAVILIAGSLVGGGWLAHQATRSELAAVDHASLSVQNRKMDVGQSGDTAAGQPVADPAARPSGAGTDADPAKPAARPAAGLGGDVEPQSDKPDEQNAAAPPAGAAKPAAPGRPARAATAKRHVAKPAHKSRGKH